MKEIQNMRWLIRPARLSYSLLTNRFQAYLPALSVGTLFLIASPVSSLAHHGVDDTVYSLQRAYKANDIDRYAITIHTSTPDPSGGSGQMKISVEMVMKETVNGVETDGAAKLTDEFETAIAEFGDQKMDATSFLPQIVQTRDKQGKLIDVKLVGGQLPGGSPGMLGSLPRAQQSFYPPNPVKVGDTWKIDISDPGDPKSDPKAKPSFAITGTGKLLGVETVGEAKILKISVVTDDILTGSSPQLPDKVVTIKGHFEGKADIDAKSAKMLSMTGETSGDSGKGDITLKLKTGDDPGSKQADAPKSGDTGKPDQKP